MRVYNTHRCIVSTDLQQLLHQSNGVRSFACRRIPLQSPTRIVFVANLPGMLLCLNRASLLLMSRSPAAQDSESGFTDNIESRVEMVEPRWSESVSRSKTSR